MSLIDSSLPFEIELVKEIFTIYTFVTVDLMEKLTHNLFFRKFIIFHTPHVSLPQFFRVSSLISSEPEYDPEDIL